MGVPALFRWLSKKYPKIVLPVQEDVPVSVSGPDGGLEHVPVDTTQPNPNGEEFDCLYLDMNGIVHPCTHPEGKPAPKTEEDMMKEVFIYTERVVNMVRPRKLLFLAIDGVAPRAKMNQQRSRRFRSAQEAKLKEEERKAAIAEWEAMGKEVSDEFRNEKAWDSNAITPGTPFMTLLAKSLRYWVTRKLNEDAGWATLQVIISDASVPGEGEHKIMDFIRRQRSHSSHDPNTKHVIYGLDADLIMLSLATHEPHFKVLREDVFAQDKKPRGCHKCGIPGHHSSQCTATEKITPPEPPKDAALKPFIFLDVSILREYLAVELSAPLHTFPFDLERAIDDWVFLIFFVGNDFLPHLPSLEIREGAIDTLLGIWKNNLERMGGYLTNSGKVDLKKAKIILEGLAMREDEIFRKRREAEERQDRNEKRRRIDQEARNGGSPSSMVPVKPHTPAQAAGSHGLPEKPAFEGPLNASTTPSLQANIDVASMVGSNASIVANRRTLRMAGLSQDQLMRAEIEGAVDPLFEDQTIAKEKNANAAAALRKQLLVDDEDDISGAKEKVEETVDNPPPVQTWIPADDELTNSVAAGPLIEPAVSSRNGNSDSILPDASPVTGVKRTHDVVEAEDRTIDDNDAVDDADDEGNDIDSFLETAIAPGPHGTAQTPAPLKLLGNNMVEQEDTVKLWEPGYKERYYRQKFGVELSDFEFKRKIVTAYVEGLSWVLEYYFQGAPSWQWYYPYHFSPFASDFVDVIADLEIKFTLGQPFKPYEQLMGVFPAASRMHIPEPFQSLMTDSDSPIIDFYPEDFHIDMNGKKMLWQGVALLPFIDEKRLLCAMEKRYPQLSETETARNTPGRDTMFVSQDHPLYDYLEGLYTKRKIDKPVAIDTTRSKGIDGFVLADPDCIPGSTFYSPLPSLPDVNIDRSISATFAFPSQSTQHRSALLPGVIKNRPVLSAYDKDTVRRGGGERQESNGFHAQRNQAMQGPGFAKVGRPEQRSAPRHSYPPPTPTRDFRPDYDTPRSRDPYGGYDRQRSSYQPPQTAYNYGSYRSSSSYAPPPQPSYGSSRYNNPPAQYPNYGGFGSGNNFGGYGGYGQGQSGNQNGGRRY